MLSAAIPVLPLCLLAATALTGDARCQRGLDWLRFAGGTLDDHPGWPNGVDLAANGDIWLTGVDSHTSGAGNVQVLRLNAAGAEVSRWTFGGSGFERGNAIKVSAGLVHVAGPTTSSNFPIVGPAAQATFGGTQDAFYAVLDANTGTILYSTYLGGSGGEGLGDLELDSNGHAWLFGISSSGNFPTTANAFQATLKGARDLTLACIDRTQPGGLRYATFFGGSGSEPGANLSDLVLGATGVVTFLADTDSLDLPVSPNAWRSTPNGGVDAFVARLDTNLAPTKQLVYSSYAGGNDFDNGNALWVDRDLVTIGGWTRSTNLPITPKSVQGRVGGMDCYLLQLDLAQPPATQLRYCTYFGSSGAEGLNDLAVDAAGTITILGNTSAGGTLLTTQGSFLPGLLPPTGTASHAFVARIDPAQGLLLYSTYVGTDSPFGLTSGWLLRPDGLGGVVAVGRTDAPSLPVTLGPALSGPFDLWVARFSLLPQGADRVGASSWLSGMAPSFLGVNRMPVSGDGSFALLTSGAPGASSSSCGVPVAGMFVALNSNPVGFQLANMIQVHLNLPILVALPAPTTPGYVPLPLTGIPKGQPAAFQCAYAYPGCPLLQASNALQIVVQ